MAGVFAILVAIGIAIGNGHSPPLLRPGRPVPDAMAVNTLFAGIPEAGTALGEPQAPVTLVEFADLQCPDCAAFARDQLPALVAHEVRPGRLRIVMALQSFIGSDSRRGAQMALAVGEQGRLWPFADLFFANQRGEDSGYVTDAFLTALAQALPGTDVPVALAARDSVPVQRAIAQASAQAKRSGVDSTPSFLLGRTGASLPVYGGDPASLRGAVDRLAGGA